MDSPNGGPDRPETWSSRRTNCGASFKKEGGEALNAYWTIGRNDAVITMKAPTETVALKALIRRGDMLHNETLVAIPRDDAIKLLE